MSLKIVSSFLIVAFLAGCATHNLMLKKDLNIVEAITLLKQKFPNLKEYPDTVHLSKTVFAEEGQDGWYLAFVESKPGEAIVSAKCYVLKKDNSIVEKVFTPTTDGSGLNFSAKDCAPWK